MQSTELPAKPLLLSGRWHLPCPALGMGTQDLLLKQLIQLRKEKAFDV